MKDYLALGPSPYDEDCAQVGKPDYHERARLELGQFKRMMEHAHPPIPGTSTHYAVETFPHDFGSYMELCAIFDDKEQNEIDWAMKAEELIPEHWDAKAQAHISAYLDNK